LYTIKTNVSTKYTTKATPRVDDRSGNIIEERFSNPLTKRI
jgi:hypothetical protein